MKKVKGVEMLNVNGYQNGPSFGAKTIRTKEFNRLGKFAQEEVGPRLKAALKEYGGDGVTVKLGGILEPNYPGLTEVTAHVSDGTMYRNCKTYLYNMNPNGHNVGTPEFRKECADSDFDTFVSQIKCAIDDIVGRKKV